MSGIIYITVPVCIGDLMYIEITRNVRREFCACLTTKSVKPASEKSVREDTCMNRMSTGDHLVKALTP